MTTTADDPKLIAEGKTKKVFDDGNNYVIIESKDDITGGDGARHDVMDGKAVWATDTTCSIFTLLDPHVPTHYICRKDRRSFIARRVNMIPIEVVMRRLAFGSYLERNPDVVERLPFERVVVEFFEKDDDAHDPLLTITAVDGHGEVVVREDAHQPLGSAQLGQYPPDKAKVLLDNRAVFEEHGRKIFEILEAAWAKLGHVLVDLKVEFGFDAETGELLLADVIDNDSWRVWLNGDPEQMVDKEVYRKLGMDEPETAKRIKGNYELVARIAEGFISAA